MYRIIEHPEGWLVEHQKQKWYGRKYWKSLFYRFTDDKPVYFYDYEAAYSTLMARIKYETIENSKIN